MELVARIKWSLYIFSILYCISSGCEYVYEDCYYDVNCSTSNIDFYRYEYGLKDGDCFHKSIQLDSGTFIPLRIKIGLKTIVESFFEHLSRSDDIYKTIIVSLEMTDLMLGRTPTFGEMRNLKMLNLSYNHINVAKLFNHGALTALENIDLSHNLIDSIQVDQDQHVYESLRRVNLSNNLITYFPEGIFERFTNLEYMDLSYNKILDIDYYTFEGLKKMKVLRLSHNNISDLNMSLFRFSNLQELYLDYNNIENLTPLNFEKLKSLRMLNLNFNKINNIEKGIFSNISSLTTLNLHHNLLSYINKDAFLSTNSLQIIDLSNNFLKSLPKDLLVNKNITFFSIIGNNLEGPILKETFEGLQLISELDISYQAISAVERLAFFGFTKLKTLLLNNNKIRTVHEQSFNSLVILKMLDLSNNFIASISFNKRDLISLEIFTLSNNVISQVLQEDFQGLRRLRVLDISNNTITVLAANTFQTIDTIETLQLRNNPIRGSLLSNSFLGLHTIPILDLSNTLLTSIKNGSLSGMVQLQEFNISRSSINKLEYSAFVNTGSIKTIDLSFNRLTEFIVDGIDLQSLTVLYLNHNEIFHISNYVFKHMTMLTKINLSYNFIQSMDDECFADQTDLLYLDVTFNNNLTFHSICIKNSRKIETVVLSGVKNVTDFTDLSALPINYIELSHLLIQNISLLHLNSMGHLSNLVMSYNNIAKIEFTALMKLSGLRSLDLSFNNISYIQAGTFKDNVFLYNLNLSHNSLTSLKYGIFRGLLSLKELDISYNSIYELGKERFYDTQNLKILIVDHNRIADVKSDFFDFQLDLLSIGHNPISCDRIISLKKIGRFTVSAIDIDESNEDNIDGIACNINSHNKPNTHITKYNTSMNERILVEIRDILLNSSENKGSKTLPENTRSNLLNDLLLKLGKYGADHAIQLEDIKSEVVRLNNIKSEVAEEVNRTNSFLERILKVILGFGSLQNRNLGMPYNKDNLTYVQNNTNLENGSNLDALISDINQVKHDVLFIENAISEIDKKISLGKTLYTPSVQEKTTKSNKENLTDDNSNTSFIYLEVCVSLILLMLICFSLYKFYETKKFHKTRSLSTRHITDSMENSNL